MRPMQPTRLTIGPYSWSFAPWRLAQFSSTSSRLPFAGMHHVARCYRSHLTCFESNDRGGVTVQSDKLDFESRRVLVDVNYRPDVTCLEVLRGYRRQ